MTPSFPQVRLTPSAQADAAAEPRENISDRDDPFPTLIVGFSQDGRNYGSTPHDVTDVFEYELVEARWVSSFSDRDPVHYEAWIESDQVDWESSNVPAKLLPPGVRGIQRLYLSPIRDGARKRVLFNLRFGYRPSGRSSLPISDRDQGVHYAPLTAASPVVSGQYTFTLVLQRQRRNCPTESLRKSFTLRITRAVSPLWTAGIDSGQVFQRSTAQSGIIKFTLGQLETCSHPVTIAVTRAGCPVQSESIHFSTSTLLFETAELPVGLDYTVEVSGAGFKKTFVELAIGDLWILSGQSNAVGTGTDESLKPRPIAGVRGVSPFAETDRWMPATDNFFEPTIGPWITAAQTFFARTQIPVGLIGHAVGSRPISYFLDQAESDSPQLKPLIEAYGPQVGLFLWYQGESDSFDSEQEASYQRKLERLVSAVRRATAQPGLHAGIVQLGKYLWFSDDHFARVREAQRQFVQQDKAGVLYSTLPYEVNGTDRIHLVTASYIELGQQIGTHLVSAEKTKSWVSPGPSPRKIQFLGHERREILVTFNQAEGLKGGGEFNEWYVTDRLHHGFSLGGFMPIEGVQIEPDGQSVRITLKNGAGTDASLSYGYRCDVGGTLQNAAHHPAAAFVGIPVEDAS